MRIIQFLKYGKVSIFVSSLCIVAGLFVTFVQGGFNLGLDFQAGLSQQVRIDGPSVAIDQVRTALSGIDGVQIQEASGRQEFIIKVKQQGEADTATFQDDMSSRILQTLVASFGAGITELQSEYVEPRFSADLASQTIFLTLMALLLILLYCWFRFKLGYAVAAIVATIHDALFMVSIIGVFQFEVSTATVAAILTIIGYSLNDTIVIFDRIRENAGLMRESLFPHIINTSTTQSLSRTIITSVTTLLAIIALYILGSGDVRQFPLNMIIGVVVGTYSSPFVACPVLSAWRNAADKRRKKKEGLKITGEALPAPAKPAEAPAATAVVEESSGEAPEESGETTEDTKQTFSRKMSREERKRKFRK